MKKIEDVDSLRAQFDLNAALLKAISSAMGPQYTDAIVAHDEPKMREIERRYGDVLKQQARLTQEQERIATALNRLRPGWDKSKLGHH